MAEPQFSLPDGTVLFMYRDAAKNEAATERTGRPIFDEVLYVEVFSPGSRGSSPTFELERKFAPESAEIAGREYKRSPHYDKYIEYVKRFDLMDDTGGIAGTPLKEWPELTRSAIATYVAMGIHSVEALANVSDERLTSMGPEARTVREKAKAFLAAANDTTVATKLAAENERLRVELEQAKQRLAELGNVKLAVKVETDAPALADAADII